MKAKRMISILLTGSMLLSLLPVSALAAPRCSMHRPDHGQKGCPPCTGGRRSRSTEEEAATRSSRDLDARTAPPKALLPSS